jgi:3',5'-cyclic AMP phosphodiesterase CpdA
MRTLAHLSDLHFGRVDPALLAPLVARIHGLAPQLVVVSGDLTQRARRAQFEQARAFLDTLPRPQLVVPGNHDNSLHNPLKRFLRPMGDYRRYIHDELEPTYADDEIVVLGVNTAWTLSKEGRVGRRRVALLEARLRAQPAGLVRIVVTHHPFHVAGADLLLSGHLHLAHVGAAAGRIARAGPDAIVVQAGTATSSRLRGEANSFNVIRVRAPHVEVQRETWSAEAGAFVPGAAAVLALPRLSGARRA